MEKLSHQKLAKTAGLLILFRFGIGVAGIIFQKTSPDLQKVAANVQNLQISNVLLFVSALASVATAIVLFDWLKKHNQIYALWMLGFSLIGFTKTLMDISDIDSLIHLSGIRDSNVATSIASQIVYAFDNRHYYGLLINVITVLPLYLSFFQYKSVPQILSIFALVAITMVFGNTLYKLFVSESSMWFYLPNGILQLVLGGWLTIKGLKQST